MQPMQMMMGINVELSLCRGGWCEKTELIRRCVRRVWVVLVAHRPELHLCREGVFGA